MPAPGAIPGARAAAPNASGTRIDKPRPSVTRPTITTAGTGARMTVSIPRMASAAQARASSGAPKRTVKASPIRRVAAIDAASQDGPEAARASGASKA